MRAAAPSCSWRRSRSSRWPAWRPRCCWAAAATTRDGRQRAQRDPARTATPDATRTPDATKTARADPERHRHRHADPHRHGDRDARAHAGAGRRRRRPRALQLRAFELNNGGDPGRALKAAQKAVRLCEGSTAVDPCAYALFEYARALRLTGDPQGAIAALEERQQRFPDNQPGAVAEELGPAPAPTRAERW